MITALNRRRMLTAGAMTLALGMMLPPGMMPATSPALAGSAKAAANPHPAVKYMQATAADLLRAHRAGTQKGFVRVLERRADVHGIAMTSLGRYQSELPRNQRALYIRGVKHFMAKYFARQSQKYRVKSASIDPTPQRSGEDWLVRSQVELTNGKRYNVTWRLRKTRHGWRVKDAKVLGFSLVYLQRGLFYKFLHRRRGDVRSLVMVLNR